MVANHVKISSRQCPKVYDIFRDAVETLDVPEPTLFIGQSSELNAYTSGSKNPFIVIDASLVEMLTEDEISAVIGHELGHIKCNHVIYLMVSDFVRDFAEALSGVTFGLGTLLSSGLELALFTWYRKAELSCDRAGLLVTQNVESCLKLQMNLAGGARVIADQMDTEEFVRQADLYSELDSDTLSKVYKFLMIRYRTHPYSVLRAKEIKIWSKSDQYQRILNHDYEKTGQREKKEIGLETQGPPPSVTDSVKEMSGLIKTGVKGLFGKRDRE